MLSKRMLRHGRLRTYRSVILIVSFLPRDALFGSVPRTLSSGQECLNYGRAVTMRTAPSVDCTSC
eukprot:8159269-Pyramimonas_sp.AAC.1